MRTIVVRQAGREGCGIAALRTLLIYLSHDRNYRYLTIEGHPPYSLEALTKAAAKEGLRIEFRRAICVSSIREADVFPLLVLTKTPKGNGHLLLVTQISDKGLAALDPAAGRRTIKIPDFEAIWTGIYAEVLSYEPKKASWRKKRILPIGPLVAEIALELGSNTALLFGFYFLNGSGSFCYPITCFFVFALTMILRRFLSTRTLKKFDQRWLGATFDKDPRRFRENYERFNSFKNDLFASPLQFFSSLFLLCALAFLLGTNNPSFFLALAGVGVFQGLWVYLLTGSLKRKRRRLTVTEESLFSAPLSPGEASTALSTLGKATYQLADEIGYSKIVFYAFCLALTFLCFIGQPVVSLNFYLFHFFGVLAGGEAFEKMFLFLFSRPYREEDEEYFREYLAKDSDS